MAAQASTASTSSMGIDSADMLIIWLCREEKIRKLEQQLRNAYGSMGRAALRASGNTAPDGVSGSVRISRIGLAAAQAPVGQSLDETLEVRAILYSAAQYKQHMLTITCQSCLMFQHPASSRRIFEEQYARHVPDVACVSLTVGRPVNTSYC